MLYHLKWNVCNMLPDVFTGNVLAYNNLTSCVCISQLLADYSSISVVPEVITHCSPLVIDTHLHSTLILIGASHQTNISISTVASENYCLRSTEISSRYTCD